MKILNKLNETKYLKATIYQSKGIDERKIKNKLDIVRNK